MLINVRGTSGSGKSTLVRKITELYDHFELRVKEGRKRPLAYVYRRNGGRSRSLVVIGHYETPCGGCDTITNIDEVFELVKQYSKLDYDVVFEGLLISAAVNQFVDLHTWTKRNHDVLVVIGLEVPLEVCLASVNERRQKRNAQLKDVNPKNTTSKWKGVKRAMERLQEAGVTTHWLKREQAFEKCKKLLSL